MSAVLAACHIHSVEPVAPDAHIHIAVPVPLDSHIGTASPVSVLAAPTASSSSEVPFGSLQNTVLAFRPSEKGVTDTLPPVPYGGAWPAWLERLTLPGRCMMSACCRCMRAAYLDVGPVAVSF